MEYKITLKYIRKPAEGFPLHSYLYKYQDDRIMERLGPIPDVLVEQVIIELKEFHEVVIKKILGLN